MHQLFLRQIVAFSSIVLCGATLSLSAQTTYQGLLEGVYPARLVIEESTPKAILSISSLGNRINFIGGCSADECKFRGIDTSLAIIYNRSQGGISGRIQYGDGSSKTLLLEQVASDIPFANTCENSFWLRAWKDASKKHQLTLATLPEKQVKGTLYLAELGTSFSVSGTSSTKKIELLLESSAGKEIGTLQIDADSQEDPSKLIATLDLEGSQTTFELFLTMEESLNCLQAAGRYDIVHPVLEGTAYEDLPTKLWKEVVTKRSDYGHVWFEPTLFNEHLISGWMHREGPNGQTSEALNLFRDKNDKLKQGNLLGGKRTRTQLLSTHKARAIEQHPLRTNKTFQSWTAELDFSKFALTTEGLSLASDRHPVYGQLQSIIPWRELPKAESLPDWLTQRN